MIIEQFAGHFLDGTSHHLSDDNSAHYGFEKVLRFFARESRLRRRILAQTLRDMHRITPPRERRIRVVPPIRNEDPYWVLLLFPFAHNIGPVVASYEEYRDVRREYLGYCLRVVKVMYPDAMHIVGFATESARRDFGSEDAAYLDARIWSEADNKAARKLQQDLGILVNLSMVPFKAKEYPDELP